MDEDFAVSRPLVRPGLPRIRFLFVRSRLCSTLPSDLASRRRPSASLALHLHQVVQGTCTPRLSNMLGTRLNRSAVGKTQISFTSRRPQRLAPSTLTLLLACTNALRRATLWHGYAQRQLRPASSLRGRPALFPKCAPCPSIQARLKQKLCPSRLRPPRLQPQGRRGPEAKPRSLTALRIQDSAEGELRGMRGRSRNVWKTRRSAHFVPCR